MKKLVKKDALNFESVLLVEITPNYVIFKVKRVMKIYLLSNMKSLRLYKTMKFHFNLILMVEFV